MPATVDLDLTQWKKVSPEGRTQKAKALSFACFYYRGGQTPPELASEGTEIAVNGEITMERSQGPYWFRTKKASATELQEPCLLELKAASNAPLAEIVVPGAFKTGTAGFETEAEVIAVRAKLQAIIEAGKSLGFWN